MENDRQHKVDLNDIWAECTRSIMNIWQSSTTTWQEILSATMGCQENRNSENPFGDWNALWSNMLNQEATTNFKNAGTFAEVAAAAASSFSEGYLQFQEWMKSVADKNESCKDHSFMKTQQDLFHRWIEFHEKEIQPLLRIPQVGLTRFYQEKMNHLVDRHNLYQAAIADFQYLLCRPMESSLCEMQEKLDKGQNGNSAEDFKQYYSTWIKTLERHYMDLLTSNEWRDSLSRVVEEAANFRMSKNELMIDFLQFLPIPTNRDMDEVYKELYTLKKTVKALLKKHKQEELNA